MIRDPHGFHVPVWVVGTGTYGYGYGSGSGDPWTRGLTRGPTKKRQHYTRGTNLLSPRTAQLRSFIHKTTKMEKRNRCYVNLASCLLLTVLGNPSRARGNLRRSQQP